MLGEVLKFPKPRPIKSEFLNRIVKVSQVVPMCRISALTSHISVPLPDSKAYQQVYKLPGWETAVCERGQFLGSRKGS